jgi:hypothetical protein
LAKEWLYIKSIFLQLGCYRFSFPGMMADCMADLLRTKAVLIPTNSFLIEINDVFSQYFNIVFCFSKFNTQPKSWQQNEAKSPVV